MRLWRVFFLSIGLLLGIFFIPPKSVLAAVNTDTMVGYWKFDETAQGTNATDSSGNSHSAAPFGTGGGPNPTVEKPTTSFPNTRSADFNGSDQYFEIADHDDFDNSPITVAFWVRFENINGTHQTLVSKWQVGVKQQFTVQLTPGGVIGFWTGDGGSGSSGALSSSLSPVEDTWYHITAVATGTTRTLYINGTDNKYTDIGTEPGDSDIELTIGSKKNVLGNYFEFFDGQIDDVRIYDRALSDDEVDELADGNHTTATWTGIVSSNYETAANWDIHETPDPYTNVVIASSGQQPVNMTQNISLASLTVNSGASFNARCFTVTYNDSGSLTNNGSYDSGCTTNSGSGTANSIVSIGNWSCTAAVPISEPDLFQLRREGNSVTLYYAPILGQNTDFVISYGINENADMYAVQFSEMNRLGVQQYTLNSLFPGTWYFKIRGHNTCMPGNWSKTLEVKI